MVRLIGGLFLVVTIAFWKRHSVARYVCSLAPLTPLTRSAALHFAPQRSASLVHSLQGLARSHHSLPRGTVEIHESVLMLKSRFTGTNAILVVTRNTPNVITEENFYQYYRIDFFATTASLLCIKGASSWELQSPKTTRQSISIPVGGGYLGRQLRYDQIWLIKYLQKNRKFLIDHIPNF